MNIGKRAMIARTTIRAGSTIAHAPCSTTARILGTLEPANVNTRVAGRIPTCVVHQNVDNGIFTTPAP